MCGVLGYVGGRPLPRNSVDMLVRHSQQRGRDSSGLIVREGDSYSVLRADFALTKLAKKIDLAEQSLFFGHSRLTTNGFGENQPVIRDDVCVIHNGIVVNDAEIWKSLDRTRELEIDTEVIAAIAASHLDAGGRVEDIGSIILDRCHGIVACAVVLPRLGKLLLFSNNGSLYLGETSDGLVFASERYPLVEVGCQNISEIREQRTIDIPVSAADIELHEWREDRTDLVPKLNLASEQARLLKHPKPELKRCSRCILPETMPFIRFDEQGVCNYCANYTPRNHPRPVSELFELVEPYRRQSGAECLVPFSGGRDSCYGLHLIVHELGLKPITYTYDWGMVTDLGRRNISRMSGEMGVENIIVAADIAKKRRNIAMNLQAWLKSPHLGMISLLTAGDKHFFKYVETMKEQTGVSLNLWGINPLEVTHFKAGFLGVPPDFEEERVYSHGAMKQLRYQSLRLRAMSKSLGYFNSSLWDTLSGEYYRSFTHKSDYYHVFDYWRWDEKTIDDTLEKYDWERAPDTPTTWRIGDGTAAFYNYVYYLVAGFTEHDTFRSNQIREGDLSREEALKLVEAENEPRYPNIKWYLDTLGMDFESVIKVVNSIKPLHESLH